MSVATVYGLAAVLTVAVAARSREWERLLVALSLAVMWGAANLLWQWNQLTYLPLLDIGVGTLALLIDNGRGFAGRVVALCYLRLGLHVCHDFGLAMVPYLEGINALYLLLLLVVAEPGVKDGLSILRRFWGDHHRCEGCAALQQAAR